MSSRIVLYLRPRCPLCDPVVEVLTAAGIAYETVDITRDDSLESLYGISIPVVTQDGEVVFDGGMDPADLPGMLNVPPTL